YCPLFSSHRYRAPLALRSFPTRRSSDLYPAGYWASLIAVPGKTDFPGTGPRGNGIPPEMKTQGQFLAWLKNGSCYTCHQLGDKADRKSTRLNSSHGSISYAVFCLKKKKN